MKKFLDVILKLIGNNLSKVICSGLDVAKSFFSYKKMCVQNQCNAKRQKDEKSFCKKVDNVTKNGTLDDLLDLKRKRL